EARVQAARRRTDPRGARGALRRPVAGSRLCRPPTRFPAERRLLPGGRARGGDADRRAPGSRPRRRVDRGDRSHRVDLRRAAAAAADDAGVVPADGDRVRPVPAPRDACRRRRPGPSRGDVRTGPADGRAAARPQAARRPRVDRAREERTPGTGLSLPRRSSLSDLAPDPTLDDKDVEIPSTLPVLPLKETVVFPQSMTPLAIGQERSIKLVDDVVSGDRVLALVAVKNEEPEVPGWDDLYEIGTAAVVHKLIRVPDGTLRILVQGLRRVRIEERVGDDPYLVGEFAEVPEIVEESKELEALTRNVQNLFGRIIAAVPYLPEELQLAAANVDDPTALAHLVASTMRLKTTEKQSLLETANVEERLRAISAILSRELEVIELGSKIQSQVQSEMEKGQREYFLRQQLKAIRQELGEGDPDQAEANDLRRRLEEAGLPEDVRTAAERELSRLERLPAAAAEHGVIRTYLEWILTLPWSTYTADDLDLDQARQVLDEDHFDLDKVKDRIIEYLAVSELKGDVSGPILCFVGPPGVGKTSLGQSIARTLGRK